MDLRQGMADAAVVLVWIDSPFEELEEEMAVAVMAQVGAALIYRRPIVLLLARGVTVPLGLRRQAAHTVHDFDHAAPGSEARVRRALREVTQDGRDQG